MSAADRLRRGVLVVGAIALVGSVIGSLAGRSGGGSPASAPGPSAGGGPVVSGRIAGPPPAVKVVAPGLPTGAVMHVPGSIAADCSADVSAPLQAWIASVPDNSTLSFPTNACYRTDETIVLDSRNHLLLDGNGTTFKSVTTGRRDRGQLRIRGGSNVTVRNLIVRGANPHAGTSPDAYRPELEAQHGFQVNGATDVLLDHVQAYDTYGDFVYIGPAARVPSSNVTVANSVFDRSGRQGISVTWALHVTIEANAISDVARSLFDLEANRRQAEIRDVNIVGNVTGAIANFWLANKGFAATIGDVTIADNRMDVASGGLIFVYAKRGALRGPYMITGNRFIADDRINDENGTGAFFFAFSNDVTIRNNDVTFPAGKAMPAVELRNTHHVSVTGNQFTNAGPTIIASQGSTDFHSS